MHNDRLLKKLSLVRSKGSVREGALGLVPMMLCCVIVRHAASVDLMKMLRIDCSGKTRIALHAPISWQA